MDDWQNALEGILYTASIVNAVGFLYKITQGVAWVSKKLRKIFKGGRHAKK